MRFVRDRFRRAVGVGELLEVINTELCGIA